MCDGCGQMVDLLPRDEANGNDWPDRGWWINLYGGSSDMAGKQVFNPGGFVTGWKMFCHNCMVRLLREFPNLIPTGKNLNAHSHKPKVGQRCCEWGDWGEA